MELPSRIHMLTQLASDAVLDAAFAWSSDGATKGEAGPSGAGSDSHGRMDHPKNGLTRKG
jgi:hypothetical protein